MKIKELEKDGNGALTYAPFTANGKLYKFIHPGTPIGISKWVEYEKLKIIAGVGKTFAEIATYLKEHKALLGSDKPFADIRTEAIILTDSMQKGIVDLSKERYNKLLYLATIFTYRDGTDPLAWSYELAEEMIADWEAERISEQDFFRFSLSVIPEYRQRFAELEKEVEDQQAALAVVSGLKKEG